MSMTFDQSHCNDPASRLDSLQMIHQQLEQALQQSQQILDLQVKLLNTQNTSPENQAASDTVAAIIRDQAALRSLFTENLLRKQVQAEREGEMKQIIHNYEKRIYDLRAMLIYKEAEIQYLGDEVARGPFKKNDIKNVSSQTNEQLALVKAIQERKKFTVEVQALQHTLKSIYPAQTLSSPIAKRTKKQENLPTRDYPGKENLLERDGLTERAMRAMIEEHQREKSLDREYSLLKRQLIEKQATRQTLKQKYIQQVSRRKKQPDSFKLKIKSSRILDTIEEASESKVSQQADYRQLLVDIELNQPEVLSPAIKNKRKATTLKQRNSRKHKEN